LFSGLLIGERLPWARISVELEFVVPPLQSILRASSGRDESQIEDSNTLDLSQLELSTILRDGPHKVRRKQNLSLK
jgi:hypothetical protein